MTEQSLTPRETAEREAARQAVVLAFSIVGTLIMVVVAERMNHRILSDLPGASERRMREAQAAATRWDRRAAYLWRVGLIKAASVAHRRAESARRAYEDERP